MTISRTKKSLVSSAIALLLCFALLLGTTFAWFTDSVTSAGNTIVAGNLKVDLLHKVDSNWISLKDNTTHKVFDYDKWEPGYTRVETLKAANLGSLALQYRLSLSIEAGSEKLGKNGENLADVIEVYVTYAENTATSFADIKASSEWTYKGTLTEVMASPNSFIGGELLPADKQLDGTEAATTAAGDQVVSIALHMQESAGNEYQELSVGNVYVNLIATQWSYEVDSFDKDYDTESKFPGYTADYTASTSVAGKVSGGKLTESVTIGDVSGDIFASVPDGVQLADGASSLKLTVASMDSSESNVTATHRSEVLHSVDVHIDGVAAGNNVPMVVTLLGALPTGLNSNNVQLYHVEGGVTYVMTLVANPTNHNEFSYDPATGDVVIAVASFSEIVFYGDTAAAWDGTVATEFNGGTGTEADPFIIANGEQLAYFRNEVDGGNTFEGKYVKLGANINLNDILFDPIGFGYDYDGFMTDGKTFNGTFDGDGHTIYGLYQNGWDLDPDKTNYSTYTYSMAGGGLFASVVDATIKNLTISGADIVFECVDMGMVVGYAQGNCTFHNINIIDCTIQNYNRYTGGVVGECSPRYDENGNVLHSDHLFEDINVDSSTVISSLWGSFDTSLGGILGGKWDKYGDATKVTMRRCNVACQIDAFNDVTSAYQWYAYRRAGMLIGNTEQSANNKALANFLTCEDVKVIYGSWNEYSYCEFENQSDAEGNPSSWNRYPWVRVQEGLSCDAYSNPRYGRPVVNGNPIDSSHVHEGDDKCNVYLPFAQLYGGGQGVYGATEHDGVSEAAYTVTYMDGDKTIKVDVIGDNSTAYTLWDVKEYEFGGQNPLAWTNLKGEKITSIAAGNKAHYTVYAKWPQTLLFSLVDDHGDVLYYKEFKEGSEFIPNTEEIQKVIDDLQNKVDSTKKTIQVVLDKEIPGNLKDASENIVVTVKYAFDENTLIPVYNEQTGELEAYQYVNEIKSNEQAKNVVIPGYIGSVPIIKVNLAGNAFSENTILESIELPENIIHIGGTALENGPQTGIFGDITKDRSHITIYYRGTATQWQEYMDYIYKNNDLYKKYNQETITIGNGKEVFESSWDNGLEKGSRVFFLDENGKVDPKQGYWELYYEVNGSSYISSNHKYIWVYHNHAYAADASHTTCNHHNSVNTPYTDGTRVDKDYWPTAN